MEMPNKRIYTYSSHPEISAPTKAEIEKRPQPAVHRTPAYYLPGSSAELIFPKPPVFNVPERRNIRENLSVEEFCAPPNDYDPALLDSKELFLQI
ncbi:uncharacterized protein N7515_004641 [Penicillium bovifimosum]|uniref:Uncharacterized protein n=1 Tax=Penicillium bovifimosum TaxID=126998 RepID=A0A9W9L3I6_9EURO|nr:uncharacterized protein N7515_004641 [Penicillium bovifimosum]KAJ5135363.1 hypothetical protein N7515_004641 [Penicillium bovifimosum]